MNDGKIATFFTDSLSYIYTWLDLLRNTSQRHWNTGTGFALPDKIWYSFTQVPITSYGHILTLAWNNKIIHFTLCAQLWRNISRYKHKVLCQWFCKIGFYAHILINLYKNLIMNDFRQKIKTEKRFTIQYEITAKSHMLLLHSLFLPVTWICQQTGWK